MNKRHSFKNYEFEGKIAGNSVPLQKSKSDKALDLVSDEWEIDLINYRVALLENINLGELTEIWNRCWRGYYFDMIYLKEHMKVWLDLSQVSLGCSMAIYVQNRVVGFALLSVDGSDGWIAAACMDPDYRGKGLFEILMRAQLDQALRLGLKQVYLEVLEQNHALKVYQSVGFTPVRQLNLYRAQSRTKLLNNIRRIIPMKLVSEDLYFENRSRVFKPSWQRREDYLKRHINFFAVMNLSGTAGALYAGEKDGILIDIWSASAAGAEEVISELLQRSDQPFSLINQPKDWISAVLSAKEIYPNAIQVEMCAHLT